MFRFVANLKPYLWDPPEGTSRFRAYLLSVDHARAMQNLLAKLQIEGRRWLVADNGNFDLMGEIGADFAHEAKTLATARKTAAKRVDRDWFLPGQIPTPLRDRHRKLAAEVITRSRAESRADRIRSVVAAQVAMRPTYLIGMEDFAVPVLLGHEVEPEYTAFPMSWYQDRIERAVEFALDTTGGRYGEVGNVLVFAGLHAPDYDVAVEAGRLAGEADVQGIACGLGAALDDPRFVDFEVRQGKVRMLGRSLPRSYLRVAAVIAGMTMGHVEATGRRPRFHALGLGTPILLPLLAAVGDVDTYTATDSTAPFADAWVSKTTALYGWSPAPLKLKAHRVAQRWLEGERAWDCPCPHCGRFFRDARPQILRARQWWRGEKRRPLEASDLWAPSPLAELLPLLGHPQDSDLRREAALARVWHNHWAIRRLEEGAQRAARRQGLVEWAENIVDRYRGAASSDAWGEAVTTAWKTIRGVAEATEGADPAGPLPG